MQKREDSSFPCNSSPTDAHREVIRDLKSLKSHRMGFSCLFFIKIRVKKKRLAISVRRFKIIDWFHNVYDVH